MNMKIIDAYQDFIAIAGKYTNIENERVYNEALEALEYALESAGDTLDDPMNPLIDMLSNSIDKYESRDEGVIAFVEEAEGQAKDLAVLRTLISQYKLTGSELPEIGGKAMVSKVLSGDRVLSRTSIERLSARFNLKPSVFFA